MLDITQHVPAQFRGFAMGLVVGVGLAWTVSHLAYRSQIEVLKELAPLDAVQTVREMRTLAASLSRQIEQLQNNEELAKGLAAANRRLDELQEQHERAGAEVSDLQRRLAVYTGSTFALKIGESRNVVPGILDIGVRNVLSSSCFVSFGSSTKSLDVGQHIETSSNGKTYRVVLVAVPGPTTYGPQEICEFSIDAR